MYAVVIERHDEDPRVVIFDKWGDANRWREHYETQTLGNWADDPEWHNFPRRPLRVMQTWEATELLRKEIAEIA